MLTESPSIIMGASWGSDDEIIFGTQGSGLFCVSGGGGEPEPLTTPDLEQREVNHTWPHTIPGREAVVFVVSTGAPLTTGQLAVLDLSTGAVTRLGLDGVSPHYVSTGHLVYAAADSSVRAVPFDAANLEVTGSAVPLLEDVIVKQTGAANFSLSQGGHLVYVTGAGGALRSLTWVDRDGREELVDAPSRSYIYPRISPDGQSVALGQNSPYDIWSWSFARQTLSRITSYIGVDSYPTWSPDGQTLWFGSRRSASGELNLSRRPADGTGSAEQVTDISRWQRPYAISRDGQWLVAGEESDTGMNLVLLSLNDGDHSAESLVKTEFEERNADISPSGDWLAYESNSSGQYEVYVRSFPDAERGLQRVSTGGGRMSRWSHDGRELFYWEPGGRMMAVQVEAAGASLDLGVPDVLFEGSYFEGTTVSIGRTFDISLDGARFLMIKNAADSGADDSARPQINVVLNWLRELT